MRHPLRVTSIARTVLEWLDIYFRCQAEIDPDLALVIETEVDDRIAPREHGIYTYLFACIYILYMAWYLMDRVSHAEYRAARRAFRQMILEAQRVFRARPTRMRDRARLSHPLLRYTQTVDGPTNCFPSMHVGLVVLAYQIIRGSVRADELLLQTMRRSCIDVCRSTMETKQHSVIDVIGGMELAHSVYKANFEGECEDLAAAVLPELRPLELEQVQALRGRGIDLVELGGELLALFGGEQSIGAPSAGDGAGAPPPLSQAEAPAGEVRLQP
ncbi:MAG: hypothetical protein FJ125_11260 [Deltaproteobacteria bacterium]|nr:hypothetical protein [Deltaproteobacteria bacterium]